MIKKFMVLILTMGSLALARSERLPGQVVRVIDGDTVRVRLAEGDQSVRLDSIDAPERRQPGGKASRQSLAGYLPPGTEVTIVSLGHDRYHRLLGQIYLPDGSDVNVLQVSHGQAWVYTKYCRDLHYWSPLEARARSAHLGLWSGPEPVPPWEYRHRKH